MPSFDPAVAPFIINTNAKSHTNGNDNSNMNANVNGNGNLNGTANKNGSVNGNANSNGNGTGTDNGSNSPNSTSVNSSPSPSYSSNTSHRGSGHNSPTNRPIRHDRKNCAPTASNAQGLFPPAACVFVGNLSTRVPLEQQGKELEKRFSNIGPCYVKTNVDRKKELPSAFVQFEKSEHAETALTWHNTMQLHDRLLRVEVSKAIRTGIMGYRNGNSITPDAVHEALLGRGALDYCTTEWTTSGITVSKVVYSFVGDYQDAMRHFQNNPDIYLKADYGIRPIYPPSPPLPQYSQPQPSYYPPAPAPAPYTHVPYTQGSGTYPTEFYAQPPPPSPPFPNYTNWTYPQEQFPSQHYQWSYGQRTYLPYPQGPWCPPHWSEPPCHPEPPHHAAEAPNPNTHAQTLHPGMFFPPAPWSEEHYAATASQAPVSQSAQAQPTVSQSTQPANGNELTPPSSPEKEEKKMEKEQNDVKTVTEESTEEKEEERKEGEAENEKKDEKKWPLVVG